jgi:antitoxin (DNA-binding transcriptional repressor) of toxin-antitoxin stability system
MRELTHHTAEIIARVRSGLTIEITQYGRTVARIVPAGQPGVYDVLVASGAITPAAQPGFLPELPTGAPDDSATDELLAERYGDDAR